MKNNFLQFLGLTKRAGKVLEGYNKCEDAIKRKRIFLILISEDASKNTVDKFISYSDKCNISLLHGYSKEELGNAIGMEEIKILGISDKNMSERLIDLWKEIKKI